MPENCSYCFTYSTHGFPKLEVGVRLPLTDTPGVADSITVKGWHADFLHLARWLLPDLCSVAAGETDPQVTVPS
jgi:hypothetical protein